MHAIISYDAPSPDGKRRGCVVVVGEVVQICAELILRSVGRDYIIKRTAPGSRMTFRCDDPKGKMVDRHEAVPHQLVTASLLQAPENLESWATR